MDSILNCNQVIVRDNQTITPDMIVTAKTVAKFLFHILFIHKDLRL